jgi:uncharacterized protein YndB with AHSA1/START domain
MVMTSGFRVERMTSAPPVRIYNLLADAAAWRQWANPLVTYSELIRQGTPDPLGAGAIRRMGGLKLVRADEEILEARPPHYQRYTAVRGIPVSHYHGEVYLNEVESGTELVWTGTFEPRIPGTGWLLAVLLRLVIATIASRPIAVAQQSTDCGDFA